MTDILDSSYINGGKTLLIVGLTKPHLIISSNCEKIAEGTQDSYCFKPVRNTLEQFSFHDNPKLTRIGNYSFYFCLKLTTVDLSPCTKLSSIGCYAFYNCSSITTFILPEGLQNISQYSFSYTNISTINIPSSVTTIDKLGICYIYTLKSITFSQGSLLTEITFNAFFVTKLLTFTVPQNVRKISGVAFSSVGTMSSIYVDTLNEYFWSDDKAIYTKDKTTIVYCASYIGVSYTILPTVTKINEGCFINCKCTEIIIPTSITEIQRYAFSNSKITSIQIPPNVTVIPYACFAGTNLQSVIIPNNVTSIEASAFASCNLLTYICVPESVDKLGGGCFPSNSNLVLNVSEKSEINIDRQLLVLSKDNTSLIQSMSTIPNIVIPSKVKLIKLNAFFGNTNLETVTFDGDSQLEKVEGSAFADCKKIKDV